MRPIATDVARSVVCLSVCLCWSHGYAVQNSLTDRDAVWGLILVVGPINHVLVGDQDRTNPFAAARVDKSVIRPFVKLLWAIVKFSSYHTV